MSGSCEQIFRPKVDIVRQSSGVLFGAKSAVSPRTLPPPSPSFGVPGDLQRTKSADTVASSPLFRSLSSKTVRADSAGLAEKRIACLSLYDVRRSHATSLEHAHGDGDVHSVPQSLDPGASESKPLSRMFKWSSRLRLSLDSAGTNAIKGPCPSSPPATLDPMTSANSLLLLDLLSKTGVLAEPSPSLCDGYTSWTDQEPQDDLCCSPSKTSPGGSVLSVLVEPGSHAQASVKSAPVSPASSSRTPTPSSRAHRFFSFRPAFLFSRCTTVAGDQVEDHAHMPMQPFMMATGFN
eukprot:jgi/Mesvir1/17159/Mv07584-RA.1